MKALEDYLLTLDICRKALPPDTEQVHFERLRKIERIVRRHLAEMNKFHLAEAELIEACYENDALGG